MSSVKKIVHVTRKDLLRSTARKKYVSVDKQYMASLKKLSYKQLLRVFTTVSATTDAERAASSKYVTRLTPPELHVAKAIQGEGNATIRNRKISSLSKELRRKNSAEISNVNIDDLLSDAKKRPEL